MGGGWVAPPVQQIPPTRRLWFWYKWVVGEWRHQCSRLCDTFDRRSTEGNIGKLTRQARTQSCDILVIYFFIVSRTSDRYPMSNLSDSEFLLNHSALINLEGDHRSMLLLGPETCRGPVVDVSRWRQLFNYFFATFSSRRVHRGREKIVSRHQNV